MCKTKPDFNLRIPLLILKNESFSELKCNLTSYLFVCVYACMCYECMWFYILKLNLLCLGQPASFISNLLCRIMSVLVPFLQYQQTLYCQVATTISFECMIPELMLQFSTWTTVLQLKVFCSSQQVAYFCLQVRCTKPVTILFGTEVFIQLMPFMTYILSIILSNFEISWTLRKIVSCHLWNRILMSYWTVFTLRYGSDRKWEIKDLALGLINCKNRTESIIAYTSLRIYLICVEPQ